MFKNEPVVMTVLGSKQHYNMRMSILDNYYLDLGNKTQLLNFLYPVSYFRCPG